MENEKLVSIITPNYNCEKFIEQTIISVKKQTYNNWELIVIDDASEDSSYEIACSLASNDSRIKVIRNSSKSGAAISRNKGLELANGYYIAFLDSDDLWEPEKLRKQISIMENLEADFSFTSYSLIDDEGNSLNKQTRVVKKLNYWKYLHHCFTGCLTVIYKKDIGENIRSFNIKNNNDYGLFLQIVRKSKKSIGIPEVLAHYRIHRNGISRNKLKKIRPFFELMHKHLHFPYLISFWFLCTNILIGKIWKYKKIL